MATPWRLTTLAVQKKKGGGSLRTRRHNRVRNQNLKLNQNLPRSPTMIVRPESNSVNTALENCE